MTSTTKPRSAATPPSIIAICIATTGRAQILGETLRELALQDRPPDRVLVCPAGPDDLPAAADVALPFSVEIVNGERGSSHQTF